jgi:PKD repeat protein
MYRRYAVLRRLPLLLLFFILTPPVARGECTVPTPLHIEVIQIDPWAAGPYRAQDIIYFGILEAQRVPKCVSITWDFGDGSAPVGQEDAASASSQSVSHIFSAGIYEVKATLGRPEDSLTVSVTSTLNVVNAVWITTYFGENHRCVSQLTWFPHGGCYPEGPDVWLTLRRSVPGPAATVRYTVSPPLGVDGRPMRPGTEGAFHFDDGAVTTRITLANEDDRCGGLEFFSVEMTLSDPPPGYELVPAKTSFTVANNDCPGVTVEQPALLCGGQTAAFTLKRTSDFDRTFTVTWCAFVRWMVHATPWHEGVWAWGTLTFEPGRESWTVTVPELREGMIDVFDTSGRRTFPLHPVWDGQRVWVDPTTVVEGNGPAVFTIRKAAPSPCPRSVPVETRGGSAKPGIDYIPTSGSAAFAPNALSTTFAVSLLDDGTMDADKTFDLMVYPSAGTCTILDSHFRFEAGRYLLARGTTNVLPVEAVGSSVPRVFAFASNDPDVVTVKPQGTMPAEATTTAAVVHATAVGVAHVQATTRGHTEWAEVRVYLPSTLRIAPQPLVLTTDAPVDVSLTLDPPPARTMVLSPVVGDETIAIAPSSIELPEAGSVTFPLRALRRGKTTLTITLTPDYGAVVHTVDIEVVPPDGAPVLESIEPPGGSSAGGMGVLLRGRNLTRDCSVTFDGSPARAERPVDPTSLSVLIPPHANGWADVAVDCGNRGADARPGAFFFYDVVPALHSIAPASANIAGGTLVRAEGADIRQDCGILFGGLPARAIAIPSPDALIAAAPPHPPGPVDVILQCGESQALLRAAFAYTTDAEPAPSVTAVAPSAAAPGELVTVIGARFRPDDLVLFGSDAGGARMTTPTSRTVEVPETTTGELRLRIGEMDVPFTVLDTIEPAIAAVVPAAAVAGSEIAVQGTGFRAGTLFFMNGQRMRVIQRSFDRAVLRVPDLAPGSYTIDTYVGSGPSFTVTADGIRIDAVTPACTTTPGGTEVILSGAGFEGGAVVEFSGVRATRVSVRDSSRIVAVAPANLIGPVTIVVRNHDGRRATLSAAFRYQSPLDGDRCE